MNQSVQILFCDTFEHKNWNEEDVNIDLVKFSSQPVVVREIRVIPDGAYVSLEPSGYTRGYTMPRSFNLEIFANNLGRSAACTFEKVGTFEYRHDKEVKFIFPSYIATDGLLIRGKYKFVSIALLGDTVPMETQSQSAAIPVTATQAQVHQILQAPMVASPCASTPQLAVAATATATIGGVIASPVISPPGIQSVIAPPMPQQVYQTPAAATSTAVMNLAHGQSMPIPQTQTLAAVAGWPAPGLQILSGVAAFNPLVPPPHQLSAYPSMSALQPPGVSGPSPYGTFDLSRPPPQAPPSVALPLNGDMSGLVAPPRRKRARSRSSSSSHRRHHHRRRRSTSGGGGGTDSSSKKRKRSSPSSSNITTTARRSSRDRSSHSRSRRATATSTSSSTVVATAATTIATKSTLSPASSSSHKKTKSDSQSSKRSSVATRQSPAVANNVNDIETRSISLAPEIHLEEGEYANCTDEEAIIEKLNFETISDEECDIMDAKAEDIDESELNEDLIKHARFNPCLFELSSLKFFRMPNMTSYQRMFAQLKNSEFEDVEFTERMEDIHNLFCNQMDDRSERWVMILEQLLPDLPSFLAYSLTKVDRNNIVSSTLKAWLADSLSLKLATKHSKPPFIVRHLKAGIKLSEQLFQCSDDFAEKIIPICETQSRLLELYNANCMSIPLKLMIIKALDASIYFLSGYAAFVNLQRKSGKVSPYQRILAYLLENPGSRVAAAFEALLRKANFCQTLINFQNLVKNLLSSEDDSFDSSERITDLLNCIHNYYERADSLLVIQGQPPPNVLPVLSVLENSRSMLNIYHFVFSQLIETRFSYSLLILLSHPLTYENSQIISAICNFINRLTDTNEGLVYLSQCKDFVSNLVKLSLPNAADEDMDEEPTCSLLQNTTFDLIHHLYAMSLIDQLFWILANIDSSVYVFDAENPELLLLFQRLFVFSFDRLNPSSQSIDHRGKRAIVRLLSNDNNLACLVPFIDLKDGEELDNKIKKSACSSYAVHLLILTLQASDSVELFKKFGEKLLDMCSKDSGSKINEIKHWIEVLRKLPAYNFDSIEYLCEKIKSFVEQDAFGALIPPGLITCLRILKFLIVPEHEVSSVELERIFKEELKYKYAIMQALYFDILPVATQIIEKLAELHSLNWQQGISLNNRCGSIFYACVLPTLSIIRHCLCYLISCRKEEFRDTTIIHPLMKMYAVCCSMLPSSGVVSEVFIIQREIVAALLSFTQVDDFPVVVNDDCEHPKAVKESLWTMALIEIMKFTGDAICNFVAGFGMLSELLPLPLPLQTKSALFKEEIDSMVSKRQLWSKQLAPLSDRLSSLVEQFCVSTNASLQHSARRIFLQLCDLSPDVAKIIANSLFNVLLNLNEQSTSEDARKTETKSLNVPATSMLSHPINLVAYLSSHAPFKCVFLDLMRERKESVDTDKGKKLLSYLIDIFIYPSSNKSHQLSQQQIATTFQSLCDDSISLIASQSETGNIQSLANCLPEQPQLLQICSSLLRNISNNKQPYATVLPALRILMTLSEHDYGIFCIKKTLDSEQTSFLSLLERLADEFCARNSDCICTFNAFLQLIDNLRQKPEGRINKFGVDFIREKLTWKLNDGIFDDNSDDLIASLSKTDEQHPLSKLYNIIQKFIDEDDSLTRMFDSLKDLIAYLCKDNQDDDTVTSEPVASTILPIDVQFKRRQVYIICKEDFEERLTAQYWFPSYIFEAEDGDGETIDTDLESLLQKFLPSFNLNDELKRKFSKKRADDAILETPIRRITRTIINTSRGARRRFVAPLRGRGRDAGYGARPHIVSSRLPNDPFRNRPPNTSRPPSLHVDDFFIVQQKSNSSVGSSNGGALRSKLSSMSNKKLIKKR